MVMLAEALLDIERLAYVDVHLHHVARRALAQWRSFARGRRVDRMMSMTVLAVQRTLSKALLRRSFVRWRAEYQRKCRLREQLKEAMWIQRELQRRARQERACSTIVTALGRCARRRSTRSALRAWREAVSRTRRIEEHLCIRTRSRVLRRVWYTWRISQKLRNEAMSFAASIDRIRCLDRVLQIWRENAFKGMMERRLFNQHQLEQVNQQEQLETRIQLQGIISAGQHDAGDDEDCNLLSSDSPCVPLAIDGHHENEITDDRAGDINNNGNDDNNVDADIDMMEVQSTSSGTDPDIVLSKYRVMALEMESVADETNTKTASPFCSDSDRQYMQHFSMGATSGVPTSFPPFQSSVTVTSYGYPEYDGRADAEDRTASTKAQQTNKLMLRSYFLTWRSFIREVCEAREQKEREAEQWNRRQLLLSALLTWHGASVFVSHVPLKCASRRTPRSRFVDDSLSSYSSSSLSPVPRSSSIPSLWSEELQVFDKLMSLKSSSSSITKSIELPETLAPYASILTAFGIGSGGTTEHNQKKSTNSDVEEKEKRDEDGQTETNNKENTIMVAAEDNEDDVRREIMATVSEKNMKTRKTQTFTLKSTSKSAVRKSVSKDAMEEEESRVGRCLSETREPRTKVTDDDGDERDIKKTMSSVNALQRTVVDKGAILRLREYRIRELQRAREEEERVAAERHRQRLNRVAERKHVLGRIQEAQQRRARIAARAEAKKQQVLQQQKQTMSETVASRKGANAKEVGLPSSHVPKPKSSEAPSVQGKMHPQECSVGDDSKGKEKEKKEEKEEEDDAKVGTSRTRSSIKKKKKTEPPKLVSQSPAPKRGASFSAVMNNDIVSGEGESVVIECVQKDQKLRRKKKKTMTTTAEKKVSVVVAESIHVKDDAKPVVVAPSDVMRTKSAEVRLPTTKDKVRREAAKLIQTKNLVVGMAGMKETKFATKMTSVETVSLSSSPSSSSSSSESAGSPLSLATTSSSQVSKPLAPSSESESLANSTSPVPRPDDTCIAVSSEDGSDALVRHRRLYRPCLKALRRACRQSKKAQFFRRVYLKSSCFAAWRHLVRQVREKRIEAPSGSRPLVGTPATLQSRSLPGTSPLVFEPISPPVWNQDLLGAKTAECCPQKPDIVGSSGDLRVYELEEAVKMPNQSTTSLTTGDDDIQRQRRVGPLEALSLEVLSRSPGSITDDDSFAHGVVNDVNSVIRSILSAGP